MKKIGMHAVVVVGHPGSQAYEELHKLVNVAYAHGDACEVVRISNLATTHINQLLPPRYRGGHEITAAMIRSVVDIGRRLNPALWAVRVADEVRSCLRRYARDVGHKATHKLCFIDGLSYRCEIDELDRHFENVICLAVRCEPAIVRKAAPKDYLHSREWQEVEWLTSHCLHAMRCSGSWENGSYDSFIAHVLTPPSPHAMAEVLQG